MFEAKIEKGKLIISIPLTAPVASKGGKMMMVASTGGFLPTTLAHDSKPLKLSLMCGFALPKVG